MLKFGTQYYDKFIYFYLKIKIYIFKYENYLYSFILKKMLQHESANFYEMFDQFSDFKICKFRIKIKL